jgi:hypothetical protein
VYLKSTYGLPLSQAELEIYQRGTGRERYDATEQREVTFIAGRRSGKTGKIAAPIVCFEAFRDHGIPRGEEAYVMLLAPTIAQARIAFRYIRNYLRGSRILYEGAQTRAKLFANLKHLLVQGKIELLDEAELLRQLRNLREEKTGRGQIDVRPGGGMRDDLAVAVALAASELTKRPSLLATPQLGIVEHTHSFPHMVPGSCPVEAICMNFPYCLDEGSCQGFVDERVIRSEGHWHRDKVDCF